MQILLSKRFFVFSVIYLVLVVLLSLNSIISFGHGLGDIAYYFLIAIWLMVSVVFYALFRNKWLRYHRISILAWATVLVLFNLYIAYSFTIGRGGERAWDGNIFIKTKKVSNNELKIDENNSVYIDTLK